MKNLSLSILTVLAVSLFSCSTESENDPQSQVGVRFNTIPPSLATQAVNKDGLKQSTTGSLSFGEGYIALGRLEFEVEADNDSLEIEFELEQNTRIDFATGVTTPDISMISIPAGTYEEVEVEIELLEGSEEPAIMLSGVYTDPNGVNHSIRFEFNSEETFEVEREGLVVFEENQVALAQITFDPVAWFLGVSYEHFANATKDANGVIVVSATQNTEIYNVVADGLDLASDVEVKDELDQEEE